VSAPSCFALLVTLVGVVPVCLALWVTLLFEALPSPTSQAPCASGAHLSRWSRHALRYSPHSILPVLPLPPSFHGVLCVLGPCLHLVTRRARAWHGQGTVCYAACMPVGCAVRSCLVCWGGCVYYAHMPVGCAASTVHTLITFSALMWPGKL